MKRIVLVVAAFAAILTAGVWFAASESYVLTLRAEVATAMSVDPHGDLDWCVVFANSTRTFDISVAASGAAIDEMTKTDPPGCVIADDPNPPCVLDQNIAGVAYEISCNQNDDPKFDICPFIGVTNAAGAIVAMHTKGTVPVKLSVSGKLGPDDDKENPITHRIHFSAPACEDAHQKDSGEQDVNCSQNNPIVLTGEISITREGLNNQIEKADLTNKKEDNGG